MADLCMHTMNRSAYLLGDEDPDLEGQIHAAAEAGFRWIGPDSYTIDDYLERGGSVAGLAATIEAAGMRTFEQPTWLVNDDLATVRKDADDMLEVAAVLRPDFLQINVDTRVNDDLLDEMRRAGDRFLELGVRLAVEYLPWLPEIRNIESTRAMLAKADIEGAGVLVDSWHFTHSDDTWEILEALPVEEIAYIQFNDPPPLESDDLVAETLGRRVMPGQGCFELERFCRVIRDKGYDRPVSCEILSNDTRHMDLGEFARRVYQSASPYWD